MLKKLYSWFYLRSVSKKKDKDDFWSPTRYDKDSNLFVCPLYKLFGKQIEAIVDIIDQEIVKSYQQTGLKISREHVLKEKWAVLGVVNGMGNPVRIPDKLTIQEAIDIFLRTLRETMKEEAAFYFEKLGKEGGMQDAYNNHLESVTKAILEDIYKKKLPYT